MSLSPRTLLHAAERLLVDEKVSQRKTRYYPVQALVLTALSAEIGMKALICERTGAWTVKELRKQLPKDSRGHDLKVLYSALSKAEQTRIKQSVNKFMSINPARFLFTDYDMKRTTGKVPVNLGVLSFDDELQRAKLVFEEWRYTYEAAHLFANATFIEALARAVVEEISDDKDPGTSPAAIAPGRSPRTQGRIVEVKIVPGTLSP